MTPIRFSSEYYIRVHVRSVRRTTSCTAETSTAPCRMKYFTTRRVPRTPTSGCGGEEGTITRGRGPYTCCRTSSYKIYTRSWITTRTSSVRNNEISDRIRGGGYYSRLSRVVITAVVRSEIFSPVTRRSHQPSFPGALLIGPGRGSCYRLSRRGHGSFGRVPWPEACWFCRRDDTISRRNVLVTARDHDRGNGSCWKVILDGGFKLLLSHGDAWKFYTILYLIQTIEFKKKKNVFSPWYFITLKGIYSLITVIWAGRL